MSGVYSSTTAISTMFMAASAEDYAADGDIPADSGVSTSESTMQDSGCGYMKITCENADGEALENVTWRVYYVGERTDDEIIFDGNFLDLSIDLSTADEADMENIAGQIREHISEDNLTADYTLTTSSLGIIEEKLPYGIYFLEMNSFERDGEEWTASPAIVEINDSSEVREVIPKITTEKIPETSTPETSVPDTSTPDRSVPDQSTPTTPNPHTSGSVALPVMVGGGLVLCSFMAVGKKGRKDKSEKEK